MGLSLERRNTLLGGPYIRLLMEYEQGLSDLYRCYSHILSGEQAFWDELAREELSHVALVKQLGKKLDEGEFAFKRPPFVCHTLMDAVDWARTLADQARDRGISMRRALELALRIEHETADAEFMKVLDEDDAAATDTLRKLSSLSLEHAKKVERQAARLRWKIVGRRVIKPHSLEVPMDRGNTAAGVRRKQTEILTALASLEEAIAKLYKTFCEQLPDSAGFWAAIADEELQHASVIESLVSMLEKGALFYELDAFAASDIQEEVDTVLELIRNAKANVPSQVTALNMALRIERILLESGFYTHVKSTAPEFQTIAQRMQDHTREHVHRLEMAVADSLHMANQ